MMDDGGGKGIECHAQMTEEEKDREALRHFVREILGEEDESPIETILEENALVSLRDILDIPPETLTYLPYTDEEGRHKILSHPDASTLYGGTMFLQKHHPDATYLDIMALSDNDFWEYSHKMYEKERDYFITHGQYPSSDLTDLIFGKRHEVQEYYTRLQDCCSLGLRCLDHSK